MIIVICNLEFTIVPTTLAPVELTPASENLAALKVLV